MPIGLDELRKPPKVVDIVRDVPAPEMRRTEALTQVATNAGIDWKQRAAAVLSSYTKGRFVTGEDIRRDCESKDIRPPHTNAWGPFVADQKRKGKLGYFRHVAMKAPKSHARMTPLYRVL